MTTQLQYKTITTPIGTGKWVKLKRPETHFVKDTDPDYKSGGYYEVPLTFMAEDCVELCKLIEDMHNANLKEAAQALVEKHIEEFPKQKGKIKDAVKWVQENTKITVNPLPFKQVRNDDGDLIDAYEFKFKQWAKGSSKKTGEVWDVTPQVRNPRNQVYDEVPLIGHGSLLRCVIQLRGYQKPTIGITCDLIATQVWELVEYHGGGGGFDDSNFNANPDAPVTAGVDDSPFADGEQEDIPF